MSSREEPYVNSTHQLMGYRSLFLEDGGGGGGLSLYGTVALRNLFPSLGL